MKLSIYGFGFVLLGSMASAHEGHQPLPTKGVQVDLANGRVSLSRDARDVIDVRTAEVKRNDGSERIRAYATLVAPWTNYAVVTSRLAGRVVALHVRPGDSVEAGQVLAELDSLDLHSLRMEYQKARNDLDLSRKILEGLEPASKSGAVAGQRLLEVQLTHRQTVNALQVLQTKAEALGVASGELDDESAALRLPVISPIQGIVAHADLAVGKFVEPTEHLMDVVDLSTVWVKIGVLERDWHRVATGQSVRVTLNGLPGEVFETDVDRLSLMLDPSTHQGVAWAELKNSADPPKLRPGMNGQADIFWTNRKQVLTVPHQAIFSDGAERYVLVEESATKDGSEYQKVAVVMGRRSGERTEILAGKILPGDRVVTRGGHQLSSLFFLGVLRVGPETARSIGLAIEPVSDRVVERILNLDGTVEVPPQRRTAASSHLAGKLASIRVDRGQPVRAGEILAEVASFELQDIQLKLLQAHLDKELWQDTYERRGGSSNVVSRRTLLETEGRVKAFETEVATLRQKLLTLGLTSQQIDEVLTTKRLVGALPVRAPIDGAVAHFEQTLGQVVRADEPLFEIHDLSQAWVQAFVGEREAAHVRAGQTARIRLVALPDLEIDGTVARIGPVVGTESRTQVVWVEFKKPPSLTIQHNMLARATLVIDRPSATLAIPLNAVVRDGLQNYVFVKNSDETFDRRRIEIGRADDRFIEVAGGVSRDELVATNGVSQLQTAFAAVR